MVADWKIEWIDRSKGRLDGSFQIPGSIWHGCVRDVAETESVVRNNDAKPPFLTAEAEIEANMGEALQTEEKDSTDDLNDNHRKTGKHKKRFEFITPDWTKSLTRQFELANLIRMALKDIRMCYNRRPGIDKANKKSRGTQFSAEKRRIGALEHQRDRLQQQKAKEAAKDESDDDNGSKNEESDDEEEEEDDEDAHNTQNRTVEEAWILQMQVLNSLALALPLLVEMLCHAERENKQLLLADNVKIVERRKASCWLFGRSVFDLTTRGLMEETYVSLCRTWASIVRHEVPFLSREVWDLELSQACLEGLQRVVANQYNFRLNHCTSNISLEFDHCWMRNSPLDSLQFSDEPQMMKTIAWTKQVDTANEVYGSIEQREETKRNFELVQAFEKRLMFHLRKRFPSDNVRLRVYGSCLSGLTTGKNWDVDISLEMDQASRLLAAFESAKIDGVQFDSQRKRLVYQVTRCLEDKQNEFSAMQPVAKARVPVVKGKWSSKPLPGKADRAILDFDICFFNAIAYKNSSLLKEYTLFDERVAALIRLIKQWAKEHKIGSAMENCISSYTWSNLAIFYLQAVGIVPNLQSEKLMKEAGVVADSTNPENRIKDLDTFFLRWDQVRSFWSPRQGSEGTAVTALFYGFIRFYARDYPTSILLVSIKRGPPLQVEDETVWPRLVFGRTKPPFTIEDPFETFDSHCPHDLNHADDVGSVLIHSAFIETERYLSGLLLSCCESAPELPVRLWPAYNPLTAKNTPGKKKRHSKTPKTKQRQNKNNSKNQSAKSPKQKGPNGGRGQGTPHKSPGRRPGRGHQRRDASGDGKGGRG
jgi:DNA polymerase sigma